MSRVRPTASDAHPQNVQASVLQATSTLVGRFGLRGLTMSKIADAAGIGRATLYRHFGDVEAVLLAWHDSQIAAHLAELEAARERALSEHRLEAVLKAYAVLSRRGHGHDTGVAAVLHRDRQVERARQRVHSLLAEIIASDADSGAVRDDVPPAELATYCIHALGAAGEATSEAALRRLVAVTLSALQPAHTGGSRGHPRR